VEYYREDGLVLLKVGPLNPYANNAYVIADTAAKDAVLVDMPADADGDDPGTASSGARVVEALSDVVLGGARVRTIVATHWHPDHWMSYDNIRAATSAPVAVYENEVNVPAERIDRRLRDGEEIRCGSARVRVIHTPGHTPGSISLYLGKVLISGDTLFNGGPGATRAPEDLLTEIESIAKKLYLLPDETMVWPGHGEGTTLGDSKREYAVFASKSHPADLCGDVVWTES
jgi:glyoxylase-like metal-dependent hydrolase (beta-lactamase superfamily II)